MTKKDRTSNQNRTQREPFRLSRRAFMGAVGGGVVATAAVATGLDRYKAFAENDIPVDRFGRMFPDLPPFANPSNAVVEALERMGAPGGLLDAQDAMEAGPIALVADPNLSLNNPDNPNHTAGSTFFGQFVDHDLTFDQTSKLGSNTRPQGSRNTRTPRFDLDSVYLSGPGAASAGQDVITIRGRQVAPGPTIYDPNDPAKLRVESGGIFEDLPRDASGTAIIGDPRNDENMIISGLHAAFLLFHNRAVDELREAGTPEAEVFATARRLTTWHYQWLVVNQFLPQFVGQPMTDDILATGPRFLDKASLGMSVEFQGAAYRFGHSMVRPSYRANRTGNPGGSPETGPPQFFAFILDAATFDQPDPDSLVGGHRAPRRFIGWETFFDFGGDHTQHMRRTKKIDTHISTPLFNLPRFTIPAPDGPTSLMQRNLLRHLTWSIPSGQAIAAEVGAPVLGGSDMPELAEFGFQDSTPLFYYVLKEAEVIEDGLHLGPTGGRIVGYTWLNCLLRDPDSYLVADPAWVPTLGGAGENFSILDFLKYARVDPDSRAQAVPPAP
jgi:heme peroxidase